MCVVTGQTFVSGPAGIKVFDGATMPFHELEVPLNEYAGHSTSSDDSVSNYRDLEEVVAEKFAETRYANPAKQDVTRTLRLLHRGRISELADELSRDIKGPNIQREFFGQLVCLNDLALQGFPYAIKKVRELQFPIQLDRTAKKKGDWEKVAVAAQLGSAGAKFLSDMAFIEDRRPVRAGGGSGESRTGRLRGREAS